MKLPVFILIISVFVQNLFGQSAITFEATVSTKLVPLDGYVEVSFILKNGIGTDFKAPNFEGFDILSGPSKSISTTVINQDVSRSFGYSYIVRPKQKGKLTIQSASIKVNNQWYKSNTISITATSKQFANNKNGKTITPKVFLKSKLSTTKAFVGQQVVLNYELYSNVPVQDIRLEKESDYKGFFVKNRNIQWAAKEPEIIDNVEYFKYNIKKVSLFAQQEGITVFDPLDLTVLVSIPDNNNSFWGIEETKEVRIKSEPSSLEVLKIPDTTDDNYNGAVGSYSINYQISQTNIALGKPTVLKLTVKGDGDPNRLFPSFLSPSDSFNVYEPKTAEVLFEESGEFLISSKSIEYTIVPKKLGQFEIVPNFVYFDPIKGTYTNSSCIVPMINVENYSNSSTQKQENKENKWWVWSILGSIIIIGLMYAVKKIILKNKNSHSDDKIFLYKLNDKDLTYNSLSMMVQEYLCKKYGISTSNYISKNLATELINKGMEDVKAHNWQNVVMHLQASVYAPISDSDIQQDIKQIKSLI